MTSNFILENETDECFQFMNITMLPYFALKMCKSMFNTEVCLEKGDEEVLRAINAI